MFIALASFKTMYLCFYSSIYIGHLRIYFYIYIYYNFQHVCATYCIICFLCKCLLYIGGQVTKAAAKTYRPLPQLCQRRSRSSVID
ncbi:hypothetical protein HanRHA438_Chr02g0053121 [Helianthus annuus]|uniref:Uncharacterized protein n=2 Tax=Helianthus annuus TaxID=4232 RepID=A0A9K3JLC1_HELAN|nr:hypothetical protein HanXRQr2_Chr02g0051791 [Helianthus annuus]KAJ0938735.1 hypothetical protein HanRHA438_Chr02g0053121 [Helianthus annuus]KAJ0950687.1 hypothetical protein HanPSC8_Chr02g0051181 [Helianthus annuus]